MKEEPNQSLDRTPPSGMTPYEPRLIRFLELWQPSTWRLKLYGIAYRKERPNAELIAAAKRVFEPLLEVAAEPNYRVGFAGVHEGKTADFVFLDFWADEDELHHHIFVSPVGQPDALRCVTGTGLSACVWDLRLQTFERDAWVAHVLSRAPHPDFEGYLAARLNETGALRANDANAPGCIIREGIAAMDFQRVHVWLAATYWTPGIAREAVERAAQHSALVIGAFDVEGAQIGYARLVSDKSRFAYLGDVIVDDAHRGRGIGRAMVRHLLEHPDFATVKAWVLTTRDAHTVYAPLGFLPVVDPVCRPEDWMVLRRGAPPA